MTDAGMRAALSAEEYRELYIAALDELARFRAALASSPAPAGREREAYDAGRLAGFEEGLENVERLIGQIEGLTSYHPHEAPYVGGDASLPCYPSQCAGGMKAQIVATLRAALASTAPAGLEDISDAVTEANSAIAHALPVIVAVRAWRDTVRSPRDPRLSQRLDQAILDAIGDFDEYAATRPAEDAGERP